MKILIIGNFPYPADSDNLKKLIEQMYKYYDKPEEMGKFILEKAKNIEDLLTIVVGLCNF